MKRHDFIPIILFAGTAVAFFLVRAPRPATTASAVDARGAALTARDNSASDSDASDTGAPEPSAEGSPAQAPADPTEVLAQVGEIAITRGALDTLPNLRDDQTRLQELISRALLLLEFQKRGAVVPETLLDSRMADIVAGAFNGSEAAFKASLAASGYTEEQFRQVELEKIEVQATRQLILREAGVTGRPRNEQAEALRLWTEQRLAETPVTFPSSLK